MYEGSESYGYMEVYQFAYSDGQFQVKNSERVAGQDLIPGWWVSNGALTNAIPDGEDLLLATTAGKIERTPTPGEGVPSGAGVVRWQRKAGLWRPVSFVPVTGHDSSTESSLIRDLDGSLLLSARGQQDMDPHAIRVWRSRDNGENWEKVIHVAGIMSSGPITLNQAADGTPYIATNIYMVPGTTSWATASTTMSRAMIWRHRLRQEPTLKR